MKKAIMAGALVLGTIAGLTTATFAQGYYGGRYDGPAYGYRRYGYNYGPAVPNTERGGPGPRVQAGSGEGIGVQR